MEFLVDPNVSYVLLVLGFLTAILALFSPGTGFLELGALTALVLAGYGIANQPMNEWAFVIMVVALVPFILAVIELRRAVRPRVAMLTLSALVFLVGATLLVRGSTWLPVVNPILILLLIPSTLGLTWLIGQKTLEAARSRPAFDPDRVVGMTGRASSDIREEGTVYVNGEEWTARSQGFIPAGSDVRVLSREGLSLEVEPVKR